MNILVVDDEESYRLLLRECLLEEGWNVFMAEDGVEGLEKMKLAKMDFIISDVYMPVMDGIKFYKALRLMPEYRSTPFLFVSGFKDDHTQSVIQNPAIEGFLPKSRPLDELKSWVKYLSTRDEKYRPASSGR